MRAERPYRVNLTCERSCSKLNPQWRRGGSRRAQRYFEDSHSHLRGPRKIYVILNEPFGSSG